MVYFISKNFSTHINEYLNNFNSKFENLIESWIMVFYEYLFCLLQIFVSDLSDYDNNVRCKKTNWYQEQIGLHCNYFIER